LKNLPHISIGYKIRVGKKLLKGIFAGVDKYTLIVGVCISTLRVDYMNNPQR